MVNPTTNQVAVVIDSQRIRHEHQFDRKYKTSIVEVTKQMEIETCTEHMHLETFKIIFDDQTRVYMDCALWTLYTENKPLAETLSTATGLTKGVMIPISSDVASLWLRDPYGAKDLPDYTAEDNDPFLYKSERGKETHLREASARAQSHERHVQHMLHKQIKRAIPEYGDR